MIIQGCGTNETIEIFVPKGARDARIIVEVEGELMSFSIDANHLRVVGKLADAAADELDARAVGGVA